jgi:hypothetical protein
LFLTLLLSGAAWAGPFTIMTQNMDEGTDYSALLTAQSQSAFLAAVTQTYNQIAATQPAVRATAMAQEIASVQPKPDEPEPKRVTPPLGCAGNFG